MHLFVSSRPSPSSGLLPPRATAGDQPEVPSPDRLVEVEYRRGLGPRLILSAGGALLAATVRVVSSVPIQDDSGGCPPVAVVIEGVAFAAAPADLFTVAHSRTAVAFAVVAAVN